MPAQTGKSKVEMIMFWVGVCARGAESTVIANVCEAIQTITNVFMDCHSRCRFRAMTCWDPLLLCIVSCTVSDNRTITVNA